ncbi:MAG TPA: single-stranded DNA-binding protein [Actinomycetes bacterium]|jgi:single-strand DNA-binding protein|nr:single-stranded DNA-binding protein [Actinomycetes bacterium]
MNETVVTMCGNLASDVRSTTTPGGLAFATFRMGSSSRRFDRRSSAWVDADPIYVSVNCWRALAENVSGSLGRGEPVIVTGRLKMRSFTKDDGATREVLEVEATAVGHDLARGTSAFHRRKTETTNDDRPENVDSTIAAAMADAESLERESGKVVDLDRAQSDRRSAATAAAV